MSSNPDGGGDGDSPTRKKSSGAPTWLIVVLGLVLLLGLLCVGGITALTMTLKQSMKTEANEEVKSSMQWLAHQVTAYHLQYNRYPDSLKQVASVDPHFGGTEVDTRDPKQASLVYLQPNAASTDADILCHTSRGGPLPILAVHVDGRAAEFATPNDLDMALMSQRGRPQPQPDPAPTP